MLAWVPLFDIESVRPTHHQARFPSTEHSLLVVLQEAHIQSTKLLHLLPITSVTISPTWQSPNLHKIRSETCPLITINYGQPTDASNPIRVRRAGTDCACRRRRGTRTRKDPRHWIKVLPSADLEYGHRQHLLSVAS